MADPTHTPGPWMADKGITIQGDVHWFIRTVADAPPDPYGRGPRHIAWLCGTLRHDLPQGWPGAPRWRWCEHCQRGHYDHREVRVDVRDDPEIEADARLLSAAPDLLEALKAIVPSEDELAELRELPPDAVGSLRTTASTVLAIRAAIAKAEGKS